MIADIILPKLAVNIDFLAPKINQFLYWNQHSLHFAKHLFVKRKGFLDLIKNSMSRANGFFGVDNENTEDPHWVFDIADNVNMQSINCEYCGNYLHSHTLASCYDDYTPNQYCKIICHCH